MFEVGGVGIKRRLAEAAGGEGPTPASSSSSSAPTGASLRGGVRRRLQDDAPAADAPGDLLTSLKKDWANGKLSSKKVLEYARGAAQQGGEGMLGIDKAGEHNAFRYLKMGYASAMAWMLFVVILAATLGVLASSRRWVYYQE